MSILKQKNTSRKFINILSSDGTFRMVVPEGTEGAEERKWETKDGKSGVKHELVFETAKGIISNIEFRDGDYGEQILVTLDNEDPEEEAVTISLNTNQPFAEDVMKKLPNIDIKRDVILRPFNFDDEEGKNRRGMSITQEEGGEWLKVKNYYFDEETKKPAHGYPATEGDEKTSDDWKVYFIKARKFLIGETKNRVEELKGKNELGKEEKKAEEEYNNFGKEEIDPSEVPF